MVKLGFGQSIHMLAHCAQLSQTSFAFQKAPADPRFRSGGDKPFGGHKLNSRKPRKHSLLRLEHQCVEGRPGPSAPGSAVELYVENLHINATVQIAYCISSQLLRYGVRGERDS